MYEVESRSVSVERVKFDGPQCLDWLFCVRGMSGSGIMVSWSSGGRGVRQC